MRLVFFQELSVGSASSSNFLNGLNLFRLSLKSLSPKISQKLNQPFNSIEMKKLLTLLALALSTGWLSAQITIAAADYFPEAGDTLKTAVDVAPDAIEITPPGGPYEWDFSGLAISLEQETVYRPASEGNAAADFQNAELFTAGGAGGETYYNVSANAFEVLGFNGPDPAGVGVETLFKFTSPIPERHAPLTFVASFASSSSVLVPFSTDAIPGAIIDSLGIPFLPDSIRVRVTTQRSDLCDAYGKLTIPGGTYDVLREKRTEFRETRVDAKVPIFGWQDVTDLILAGGNFEGLGKDTVITYNFFSKEAKEAIAVVTMDNSGSTVQQVRFKNNGVLSDVNDLAAGSPSVFVSPNPIASEVKFELKNFTPGNYALQIFNANGAVVLTKNIRLNSEQTESLDLSSLGSGQYFYRILNEKNTLQTSGKILKINP
jgi:hypothetical protein